MRTAPTVIFLAFALTLPEAYGDTGADTDANGADSDATRTDTDLPEDSDSVSLGDTDATDTVDSGPPSAADSDGDSGATGSASALSGEPGGLGCRVAVGAEWNLVLGACFGFVALALRSRRI